MNALRLFAIVTRAMNRSRRSWDCCVPDRNEEGTVVGLTRPPFVLPRFYVVSYIWIFHLREF